MFLRVVALGAARGRLEAVLEAALEAVPRGRRKAWAFPIVLKFKRFFQKKPSQFVELQKTVRFTASPRHGL